MDFEQEPNYEYLRNLFKNVMKNFNYTYDFRYDWMKSQNENIQINISPRNNIITHNNIVNIITQSGNNNVKNPIINNEINTNGNTNNNISTNKKVVNLNDINKNVFINNVTVKNNFTNSNALNTKTSIAKHFKAGTDNKNVGFNYNYKINQLKGSNGFNNVNNELIPKSNKNVSLQTLYKFILIFYYF